MPEHVEITELWTRETVRGRPGTRRKACRTCGGEFEQGSNKHPSDEPIWVCEIRWTHFRGDDEVQFFHEKCSPIRVIGPRKVEAFKQTFLLSEREAEELRDES